MVKLYSYCIPIDDGAAPNPFGGACTLAICKPQIRRTAKVGDWIVGTGSKRSPAGNLSGAVVYAMRVTQTMRLREYDHLTRRKLQSKIPNLNSSRYEDWLGDSIYKFDRFKITPTQRQGVHGAVDVDRDLSGLNVLLSDHFYYFGKNAVPLPSNLKPIVHQTQGHKVRVNEPYKDDFIQWLESHFAQGIHGQPATDLKKLSTRLNARCIRRMDEIKSHVSSCRGRLKSRAKSICFQTTC
ncbi:hypothetical protein ACSHT0_14905 [Tepidicaulis sp. LMO-SS28]|uniref:Nmad2 family putative nucleotide modification protein n=1 Tax=Tepidicaulis sp. LMO-SS28 TaxID=3447455 RepID=UPI003EE23440